MAEPPKRRYTVVETKGGFCVYDTVTGAMQTPWKRQSDAEADAASWNAYEERRCHTK